jgi:hypothetical protein
MAESIVRACKHCGKAICIERGNVHGILKFEDRYFHNDCFIAYVQKKLSGKKPRARWKEELNNISEYENDAREAVEFWFTRDDIYRHILEHYDVVKVESPIFSRIDAVITGTYGRRSKPIDYVDFVECWRYGQSKLDEIARKNRAAGKNITGEARVNYDLAVVVKKFPQWKKWQEKLKAERIETERAKKEAIHIDYDNMYRKEVKPDGIGDLSSILDEFF